MKRDEPRDVYAEPLGSSPGNAREPKAERMPTLRLEPCVALMGYDAERSKQAARERGW